MIFSSIELTTLLLERIEALDGKLQSYITVMAGQALAAAEQADRELAPGQAAAGDTTTN